MLLGTDKRQDTIRKRWRQPSPLLLALGLAVLVCTRSFAAQPSSEQDREAPPNSIQIVVNGVLKKTWTANELMGGRFDWVNPKGKFRPAVPLTYALTFKEAGLTPDTITELRVLGKKEKVTLTGEALILLKEVLLMVNIDRAGAWKLAVRTQAAEDKLRALLKPGGMAVEAIRRIEVVTGPVSRSKK